MEILALLPLLSFVAIFICLGQVRPTWGWRRSFLRSVVLIGVYGVLSTEALNIFRSITLPALIISWSLPLLGLSVSLGVLWRRNHSLRLPTCKLPGGRIEWLLVSGVVIILVITAIVAWFGPPNTWDSLTTHMSRVAHWSQEASIDPYITGNEKQNYYPPVPAMAVLNVYVLSKGDHLVNFINWFALLTSIVGTTLIARDFGAGSLGQAMTALFVASLPMGIAQASSTQTDLLVALWLVCIASETVLYWKKQDSEAILFTSLAAGLAIGTKPIAYPYLIPFGVFLGVQILKSKSIIKVAQSVVILVIIVITINLGYFSRNFTLYGTPFGPQTRINTHSNEFISGGVLVSNLLRNASLHAGTPSSSVNQALYIALAKVHWKLGLGLSDPRTSIHDAFDIYKPESVYVLCEQQICPNLP